MDSDYNHLIIDLGASYCKYGLSKEIKQKHFSNNESSDNDTLISGICYHKKEDKDFFHSKKDFKDCIYNYHFKYPLKFHECDYYREYPDYYELDDYKYMIVELENDIEMLEKIYDFLFSKIDFDSYEQNVLLTEKGFIPKIFKTIDAELMFETFDVQNLYIANIGALSLLSQEKFTGIAVDIGYTAAQIIPVFEGTKIATSLTLNCGAKDMDTYLFNEYKRDFGKKIPFKSFEKYREENCSFDPNHKLKDPYIEGKLFRDKYQKCPEVLFNPELNKNSEYGIVGGLIQSIKNFEENEKKELFGSICLSGGITYMNGFLEKFRKELIDQLKSQDNEKFISDINIIAANNRNYNVLIGGALFSEMGPDSMWVSRKEYKEFGSNIVFQKCF